MLNYEKKDLKSLVSLYKKAKKAYYETGSPIMSDAEFDVLEEKIRSLAPEHDVLHQTGILGKKADVKLKVPMASLDKFKSGSDDFNLVRKRLAKYGPKYLAMEKLDGCSLQAVYRKGKRTLVATRGDGSFGKDISFLLDQIEDPVGLPKELDEPVDLVVRQECLIPKQVFQSKFAEKYDSARALVSGILNRRTINPRDVRHLRFVSLRCLRYNGKSVPLLEGIKLLKKLGFDIVRCSMVELDEDVLNEHLTRRRESSPFEIDGIVLASTGEVSETVDRPKWAIAFKRDDVIDAPTTTVEGIEWNESAFGVLVPKAIVSPVKFGGVTVRKCALHNAEWAMKNGIGIGAVVKIVRSGDIIPKIVDVVKKGKKIVLPAFVEWDGPNLVSTKETGARLEKRVERFHKYVDWEDLGPKVAASLVRGGLSSPGDTLLLSSTEWMNLTNCSEAIAKKRVARARELRFQADLIKTLPGSGVFDKGIGSKAISSLVEGSDRAYRMLSGESEPDADWLRFKAERLVGKVFASNLCDNLSCWLEWVKKYKIKFKPIAVSLDTSSGVLSGKIFSWTGYRDKEEETWIQQNGGKVASYTAKTDILFYRVDGKSSSKVSKAGDRVRLFKEFVRELK